MDLIIIFVLLVLVVIFFKDLKSFIYGLGIIEIFLRLLTFLKLNIGIPEISNLINKYIPETIIHILDKYADGLFYTLLVWLFFIAMVWFLIYLIKYFFKRK